MQSDDEDDADLQALREALESIDRGEAGQPVEEVFKQLREKYQIPEPRRH